MKVKELIKILGALPPNSDVSVFWDGNVRGDIEGIVNDHNKKEVVIIGEWSVYHSQAYPEEMIVYG